MGVTDHPSPEQSRSSPDLGWSSFFADQLTADDAGRLPLRIDAVHRGRITALSQTDRFDLVLPTHGDVADFAVGDWILADPSTRLLSRRLTPKTLLQRRGNDGRPTQLIAANIDTLFIVTSCNADFNVARLERYLAVANDAGTDPVIVLTKVDAVANARDFARQAAALQRELPVVVVNARAEDAAGALAQWCGPALTVALVGSSGVGKSTLVNALVGRAWTPPQQTGSVREHDSKGRHVTTSRSLHSMSAGGWVIDTPAFAAYTFRTWGKALIHYSPRSPSSRHIAGSVTAPTTRARVRGLGGRRGGKARSLAPSPLAETAL